MKNHEEFRATVFEKAKKYEAQRKARNKKIIESISLCSLVIVITLSAYLGILTFPEQLSETSEQTTTAVSDTTATQITDTTTQTTATATQTETTTATTTATTIAPTSVESTYGTTATIVENTTGTTVESTIETTTTESTEFPLISKLEFRGTAKDPDFDIFETELLEIKTLEEWEIFREENVDDYPDLQNSTRLDTKYFETHTLVVVQYAGYDVIAFSHNFTSDSEESYVLQIALRKNPKNTRKQIHIMSVEKETFQYAEIRIWEK